MKEFNWNKLFEYLGDIDIKRHFKRNEVILTWDRDDCEKDCFRIEFWNRHGERCTYFINHRNPELKTAEELIDYIKHCESVFDEVYRKKRCENE